MNVCLLSSPCVSANLALVRPVHGVLVLHVPGDLALGAEGPVAEPAAEGPLAGVYVDVAAEVLLGAEPLVADLADVRPVVVVAPHVADHEVLLQVRVLALAALEHAGELVFWQRKKIKLRITQYVHIEFSQTQLLPNAG